MSNQNFNRRPNRHNGHSQDNKHLNLPTIVITDKGLAALTEEALTALKVANRDPKIFVRSGKLCRLRKVEDRDVGDRLVIEPFSENALRGLLARTATFKARKAKGQGQTFPASPPKDLAKDILSLPEWPFPGITGIIEIPALRPDGTIIHKPGYDAATGLYYWPKRSLGVPRISEHPMASQVQEALALLDEAIGEFPYLDDASKANALALMLTPIIRPAVRGCVPLALLDAPQQGTGKGLLANVICVIGTGRKAAMRQRRITTRNGGRGSPLR